MQQESSLFQFDTTSPQATSQISQAFTSGDGRTDTILDNFSWTGKVGQPTKVTYGFDGSFDSGSRSDARAALQQWANVANVSFTPQTTAAQMVFFKTSFADPAQGGVANTSFVGTTIKQVDVEISVTEPTLKTGSFGYTILLHEIGHALGLKHPGNYGSGDEGPFLSTADDNFRTTVMSYNPDAIASYSNPPTTPMLYDIAAMQYLYGANTAFNAGNTPYNFTGESKVQTIWDGGGIDTFSASNYKGAEGVRLDLASGLDNYSKIGQNYVWAAFGANIENAEGSGGADNMSGNGLGNILSGRGGADDLRGEDGDDTIFGGTGIADPNDGDDKIVGGLGNDQLYGNAGNDTIYGGRGIADSDDGSDLIFAGKGADVVYGNAGNDTMFGGGSGVDPLDQADLMYGGKGADIVYGNGNDDTIYGGGSGFDPEDNGDAIYGGAGNDALYGNGGSDSLFGGEGNDTLNGGAGDDMFFFDVTSSGADVITGFEGAGVAGGDKLAIAINLHNSGITFAADMLARITYDGTNAFVDLGQGHSVQLVGIGAVTLNVDDIVII
jgi:serralysin